MFPEELFAALFTSMIIFVFVFGSAAIMSHFAGAVSLIDQRIAEMYLTELRVFA